MTSSMWEKSGAIGQVSGKYTLLRGLRLRMATAAGRISTSSSYEWIDTRTPGSSVFAGDGGSPSKKPPRRCGIEPFRRRLSRGPLPFGSSATPQRAWTSASARQHQLRLRRQHHQRFPGLHSRFSLDRASSGILLAQYPQNADLQGTASLETEQRAVGRTVRVFVDPREKARGIAGQQASVYF